MTYPNLRDDYLTGQPYPAVDANQERTVLNQVARGGVELYDYFAGNAVGAPVAADTRQNWVFGNNRTPNLTVSATGKLYDPDTVAGVSYKLVSAPLSASGAYLACEFNFGATGSTNTQVLDMGLWVTVPVATGGPAPDSPCEILVGDTLLTYRVCTLGAVTNIMTYPFTSRGTARQRVEVALDKTNSLAVVRAPDGVLLPAITHPLIGSMTAVNASFGSWRNSAATEKVVEIQTVAAGVWPLPPNAQAFYNLAYAQLELVTTVTGAYTVTAKDINRRIEYDSITNGNITIPADLNMAVAGGCGFSVLQVNTGVPAIVAGAGVNPLQGFGSFSSKGRWALIGATKRVPSNTWFISGDTA